MSTRTSASERLLDAASELFYREGVQTVGIDRVIERAGVAKASLYNTFGSKEALVTAYLERRHAQTAARLTKALERYATPRERLLGAFDAQAELVSDPAFNGCAFANATTEARDGGAVRQAAQDYRQWIRTLFRDLAAEAGSAQPDALAAQLQLLYDGTALSGRLEHDRAAAVAARAAAETLLDASLAGPERDQGA